MTIIIDIGNTSVKLYKLKDGRIIQSDLFEDSCDEVFSSRTLNPEVIIVSVVPKKTSEIAAKIKKYTKTEPLVLTHEHYPNLKTKYYAIKELGIDRLCNVAFAVKNCKKNAVIIDLGSAVTFDVINGKGEFEGGMILPGIRLQYESLAKNTALLPDLDAEVTDLFIGRSTEECIRSGVQNGIAGLCNDFVKELGERLSSRVQVVLSGGDAELIGKLVDFDFKIEKHTVPLGAYTISQMIKR